MTRLVGVLLLGLLAACSTPPVTDVPPSSAVPASAAVTGLAADRIQILHTDDIHGHLDSESVSTGTGAFAHGGMAALAGQIAVLRQRGAARTLLLDGGDAWQGTFISNANKGAVVDRVMSLMRYDAMTVGNHDFDWGQDVLAQRAKEATFPFLATNVVETATGKLPPYLLPYVVKDLGITTVGIVGVTNPASNTIVKATSVAGLRFGPAADVAPFVAALRQKVDIVVVLAHIGSADAARLAREVPGIDVIVAAHDHQPLQTARLEGSTTIIDAGAYTQFLGRLELVIDPATRKLKEAIRSNVLIAVASSSAAPADPEIAAIVDAERAAADKYTSRVVGALVSDLDDPREESALGDMIGDALVEYGRRQGWRTDVAFYNAGGIRAPLRAGPVTYGELFRVLPFGNAVVNVDLTGAQVREVLEDASGRAGRLQVGGGTWAYRPTYPPGRRVLEATIGGQPLDPARVYHVATIDYLLLGGDGHTWFGKGGNVIYGDVDVDAVAAYMTAHSPLDPRVEGRIVPR